MLHFQKRAVEGVFGVQVDGLAVDLRQLRELHPGLVSVAGFRCVAELSVRVGEWVFLHRRLEGFEALKVLGASHLNHHRRPHVVEFEIMAALLFDRDDLAVRLHRVVEVGDHAGAGDYVASCGGADGRVGVAVAGEEPAGGVLDAVVPQRAIADENARAVAHESAFAKLRVRIAGYDRDAGAGDAVRGALGVIPSTHHLDAPKIGRGESGPHILGQLQLVNVVAGRIGGEGAERVIRGHPDIAAETGGAVLVDYDAGPFWTFKMIDQDLFDRRRARQPRSAARGQVAATVGLVRDRGEDLRWTVAAGQKQGAAQVSRWLIVVPLVAMQKILRPKSLRKIVGFTRGRQAKAISGAGIELRRDLRPEEGEVISGQPSDLRIAREIMHVIHHSDRALGVGTGVCDVHVGAFLWKGLEEANPKVLPRLPVILEGVVAELLFGTITLREQRDPQGQRVAPPTIGVSVVRKEQDWGIDTVQPRP